MNTDELDSIEIPNLIRELDQNISDLMVGCVSKKHKSYVEICRARYKHLQFIRYLLRKYKYPFITKTWGNEPGIATRVKDINTKIVHPKAFYSTTKYIPTSNVALFFAKALRAKRKRFEAEILATLPSYIETIHGANVYEMEETSLPICTDATPQELSSIAYHCCKDIKYI